MCPANHIQKATVPFILSLLKVSQEELRAQGLEAQELADIYNDYSPRLDELEDIGLFLSRALKQLRSAHAVCYRVKEPLHLLKKIIRKKKEYPNRHLTSQNYLSFINDLVGVRILHLNKRDCHAIGHYIQQHWELKRAPYAYVSSSHSAEARQFAADKYKVLVKDKGYRAQHYILRIKPNRQQYLVEVQVKTLFEEGWSEIDHCIRYPDHEPNELLNRLLAILNQLTSNADVVATQIQALANELQKYKQSSPAAPEVSASRLRGHIEALPVDEQEKQYLYACLATLTEGK
ncbi:RelA/SpoT domain-containing protein [Pontibacter kalidii]|uniref:RelA/SpoT domain-containing protein n=1 Tax=Pontibacter kalidii TaxID=2592049 RepID=UPI00224DD10D|nr:RelA/SpoT domain-containing protein [Pontibacter kalidii]